MQTLSPRPPGPLYHLTCLAWAKNIVRERRLRVGESSIRADGSGPKVVWFTTDPTPTQEWACVSPGRPPATNKNAIRITVALPQGEPQWWPLWAREKGIQPWWYDALAESGGSDPDNWWIVTRPVPTREFTRIEDVREPDAPVTLWTPEDGPPSLTRDTPLRTVLRPIADYSKAVNSIRYIGQRLRILGYPTD